MVHCASLFNSFYIFDYRTGNFSGSHRPVELKLIEFKAETYNGLLRLLRPGCRTMILILDKESKDSLGAKFFKTMWPYRRNKTLNFGYMFIGKKSIYLEKI